MQHQSAAVALRQLPAPFLLFLFATTAFAIYIVATPGPADDWWLDPMTDAMTVMTTLIVAARFYLSGPSRSAQRIWAIACAVLVIFSLCQLAKPFSGELSRYLAVDDLGDCLMLVTAPVFLWATARIQPAPVAARRILWSALAVQTFGVIINLAERQNGHSVDMVARALANDLDDFLTMQLYLVAAALYITEGLSPGRSLITPFERILKGAYYRQPGNGLHGKHTTAERLIGLEDVLTAAPGSTVLDLGCAEGLIAAAFLARGAAWVDGFEVMPRRVKIARKLVGADPALARRARFRTADLDDWPALQRQQPLLCGYDIVLFLGVYQHLAPATRAETLRQAAARCNDWFAVRAPRELMAEIDTVLVKAGFARCQDVGQTGQGVGHLAIYERMPQ